MGVDGASNALYAFSVEGLELLDCQNEKETTFGCTLLASTFERCIFFWDASPDLGVDSIAQQCATEVEGEEGASVSLEKAL